MSYTILSSRRLLSSVIWKSFINFSSSSSKFSKICFSCSRNLPIVIRTNRGHPIRFSTVATNSSQKSEKSEAFKKLSSIRNHRHWRMSAQLAKPFTVYVAPESSSDSSDELSTMRRKFRLLLRVSMENPVGREMIDYLLNFERDYDDPLEGTLTRLRMKLMQLYEKTTSSKTGTKKGKRAKLSSDESAVIDGGDSKKWNLRVLNGDGIEMSHEATNESAFLIDGRSLVINDQSYRISGPTPSITKAEVDLIPMVQYPCMPSVNVTEDSSVETCQYFWFTGESKEVEIKSKSVTTVELHRIVCDHDENGAIKIREMNGWNLRSTERVFVPTDVDTGRHICLIVSPRNVAGRYGLARTWTTPVEKSSSVMFRKGLIMTPPEQPMIWDERHRICETRTSSDTIRCVSYNILADLYMNLSVADKDMYFPYCPKRFQEHSYRYPLILKEIEGYQADLYCLQEVDTRMYERFLLPYLSMRGYRGVRKLKGGVVNEGSTIFYRPERFELINSDDHIISDLLSKSEAFDDLARVAKQSDVVWKIFLTRPATIQVAVFRCLNMPNSFICVGNTHLHFKPHHSPIRILQAATGYRHLLNVAARVEQQFQNAIVAVMFCGDFNSRPDTGVYSMFQNGRLDSDHQDWQPQAEEPADQECDADQDDIPLSVQGVELSFAKPLRSACPSVKYTTSTHLFRNTLDHIFISDELTVDRVIPMPDHELVTKFVGIPSPICPSDHLPLICEVKFS